MSSQNQLPKPVKIILWIVALTSFLLCMLWLIIARPLLFHTQNPALNNSLSAERLKSHVRILSENFTPRNYQYPENLNATALYIQKEFEAMGLVVTEQRYLLNGNEYKNLVISLGPENGSKIIIGAHYDAAGPYPGADDNASGIAGLIELARILSQQSLQKNITLVAYTLEEPPIYASSGMGSYVHAKSEFEKDQDIDLMISLEMIGYFSEKKGSQTFPLKLLNLFYPTKGNYIVIVDQLASTRAREVKKGMAKAMSIPVHSINAPKSIPGIDFSDHRSYWNFGYDAIMISDTSFYRNSAYHTQRDTYERLDYKKMAEVVNGLGNYLLNP